MFTVTLVVLGAAFVCTIAAAINPPKCPLWVPVLLLCVAGLLAYLPK
jgi:hypothetical protein